MYGNIRTNKILISLLLIAFCMSVIGFTACGKSEQVKKNAPSEKVQPENKAQELSIVLVTERGGIEKSKISAMFLEGCKKAEENLGVKLTVIVPEEKENYEDALERGIATKPNIVLCGGPALKPALKAVAFKHQDINFACVSDEDLGNNVVGISFREEESGFLAGIIAAAITLHNKGDVVSFMTAADTAATNRLKYGFFAGVKTVDKNMFIVTNCINDWNDQDRAREVALAHHALGADVIFMAAGESGKGILKAAEEKKFSIINQGTNITQEQKNHIVSSVGKRVDKAVYSLIKAAVNGKFPQYNMVFSIADGGIEMNYDDSALPPEVEKLLNDYIEKIKQKKIVVPSDWADYESYERSL